MANIKKSDLIAQIAKEADASKTSVATMLDSFINVVTGFLANGDNVALIGFGTFSKTSRKARNGRNPKTGEVIKIDASNSVKFKSGAALKEAVNKKKKK